MKALVTIVGAGMAGMLTAAEFLRAGVEDLLVLEASEHPGGVAATIRRDGFTLEPAAGTLTLPHPALSPILQHFGVQTTPAAGPATRYVFTGDRLVPLPPTPRMLAAPLLPAIAKLRVLAEAAVGAGSSADESLAAFARRRVGRRAGDLLAWMMASGVFAGDPERLSVSAAFPSIVALEQDSGSVIRGMIARRRRRPPGSTSPATEVPIGGMVGITDAIAAALGPRLVVGSEVGAMRADGGEWILDAGESFRAQHVVFACEAATALRLLRIDLRPPERAPVVVAWFGAERDRLPIPEGFGVLTTPGLGLATLGVLLESSYAPDRSPDGHNLVKVIAGGATRPEVADWSTTRLIDHIGGETARILGESVEVSFAEVMRHNGIPQYEMRHNSWLRWVSDALPQSIHLAGWDYRGVGIPHLAADARRIVSTVKDPR